MNDESFSHFVPNVHFELIPIRNLVSNQEYQRSLSHTHVELAAENFDLRQINPVKVSRRNGVCYVFNGQHTVEIVAMRSGSRDTPVWCMVYDDLEYEEEADIFANQMKYVRPLKPLEIFNANIEAGNPDQIIIKKLVESVGLEIGSVKRPGTILAVGTLENVYTKYGYHILSRVLMLCGATWEGDVNSFSANMLRAVTKLVVTYGEELDDEIFVEMRWEQVSEANIQTRKRTWRWFHVLCADYFGGVQWKAPRKRKIICPKALRKNRARDGTRQRG